MVASLLRIVHSGPQNERLNQRQQQPQTKFFHKIFRREGRFTTRWERLDFNIPPQFGQQTTAVLPRKGHLLSHLYLITNYPTVDTSVITSTSQINIDTTISCNINIYKPSWTNSIGHALIQNAELQIGGVRIERLDGQLLEILDEFNTPLEKVPVVNKLIGRYDNNYIKSITTVSNNNITSNTFSYPSPLSKALTTATPLPFFFNRGDSAAALPVDAIQADEIRLQINFRPFSGLYYITPSGSNLSGTLEGSALPPLQKNPQLGDTYLLAEYIYLDAPEANRFRIADISLPITQHYPLQPLDTQGLPQAQIDIAAPNPVRDIFFYCQPWVAPAYNAHFLSTKYISSNVNALEPWWPDAQGLNPLYISPLKPGFWPDKYDSEPITSIALQYEGRLTKFSTENTALFRHVLPSLEQKKAPWVNRYYYNIPFGVQHGLTSRTTPTGEVNYDKISRRELQLTFPTESDGTSPRLWVRTYVETYNILRIYGGRAGTLFGY